MAERSGEFDRIRTFFAPLAEGAPGALSLSDDAALIDPSPGYSLTVTLDTLVEGVHFIGSEDPARIAQKSLRVNLSDLAAMGAEPLGYFLSLSLPDRIGDDWISAFCTGLAQDQRAFGWHLHGGDSTRTPGPISLSITALGQVPVGQALRRSGAQVGDGIYVSGTIGDGALGLLAAQGRVAPGPEADALQARYELPEPRLALGVALRGKAHAAMDISDGLVADLGHICKASGVGAQIEANQVPLSSSAAEALADSPALIETVLTGGDDYELLVTGPQDAIQAASKASGIPVTRIGEILSGSGVTVLDKDGEPLPLSRAGWQHS